MHTLSPQSLSQISTKLRGRRKEEVDLQDLNLSHIGHSISHRNFSTNHGRERGDGRTLAFRCKNGEWAIAEERKGTNPFTPSQTASLLPAHSPGPQWPLPSVLLTVIGIGAPTHWCVAPWYQCSVANGKEPSGNGRNIRQSVSNKR
jgi:hypothetical protein